MRIERIDEKTVKCFISNEEMEEYEITYKDFLLRSDKAREIVEEIIEQAEAQVGYEPPRFALDLQIMMMPERGMVLTFSEKTPEDVKNNPTLMDYLREMRRILEESQQALTAAHTIQKGQMPQEKAARETPGFAIFKFEKLRDICDYVKILPKNMRVESRLYRMGEEYYLYVDKGGASYKRYSHACVQALEFGVLHGASEDSRSYLMEHGECLIEEKAISRLKIVG